MTKRLIISIISFQYCYQLLQVTIYKCTYVENKISYYLFLMVSWTRSRQMYNISSKIKDFLNPYEAQNYSYNMLLVYVSDMDIIILPININIIISQKLFYTYVKLDMFISFDNIKDRLILHLDKYIFFENVIFIQTM